MSRPWLNTETAHGLLHARTGVPDRWDVSVDRCWAMPGPLSGTTSRQRYAAQVRQDLWRAVQAVRGFVPRVLVRAEAADIHITAGGVMVTGRTPPGLAARLAAILDNPDNRSRWDRFARARGPRS